MKCIVINFYTYGIGFKEHHLAHTLDVDGYAFFQINICCKYLIELKTCIVHIAELKFKS